MEKKIGLSGYKAWRWVHGLEDWLVKTEVNRFYKVVDMGWKRLGCQEGKYSLNGGSLWSMRLIKRNGLLGR